MCCAGLFTRPMARPLFLLMVLRRRSRKDDGWFWNKIGSVSPVALGVLFSWSGDESLVIGWVGTLFDVTGVAFPQ